MLLFDSNYFSAINEQGNFDLASRKWELWILIVVEQTNSKEEDVSWYNILIGYFNYIWVILLFNLFQLSC